MDIPVLYKQDQIWPNGWWWVMVLNATWSVLLVEDTGVPRENH
jgi:hypothetical protein